MVKKPRSEERWDVVLSAAVGAVLGVLLSTARHVLHDHSGLTAEQTLWDHFIPQMLAAMAGGAIALGGAVAVLNRLKRRS